ncbi:MAG TPA: arginine decarboxylase [Chitinophagales bacterium]|nr:arginine decarboxylase [Chitinophagales bacterium]
MINKYQDLIEQTFYFPQEGFRVENGYLFFHDLPLKELIDTYGTPIKITYLPKIGQQVQKAKHWFNTAMQKLGYKGNYHYCYVTKSCHFKYILTEVLENGAQIETSSSFDIDLILNLYNAGKLTKSTFILNNGFKPIDYAAKISHLINEGFNCIPILDNDDELDLYLKLVHAKSVNIGIRVATEQEPRNDYYTSRLGIRSRDIIPYYQQRIANNPKFKLTLLHFFVDTGIKDTIYYWGELKRAVKMYCDLRKICPTLTALNIGGGLPIKNSLAFQYDYEYMIGEIVSAIYQACEAENIPHPDIFTEFGKFSVGESGAVLFSVLNEKQQNEHETWYMLDNSLMTTIPDAWGMSERFILLPINKWQNDYQKVNLGGLSCDGSDYYNSEAHATQIYLPTLNGTANLFILVFLIVGPTKTR